MQQALHANKDKAGVSANKPNKMKENKENQWCDGPPTALQRRHR
eukprot:SAG11_NODE_5901_length_1437_cov_2.352018_1_plen_43_part_01